jgi:hypothetical protein
MGKVSRGEWEFFIRGWVPANSFYKIQRSGTSDRGDIFLKIGGEGIWGMDRQGAGIREQETGIRK